MKRIGSKIIFLLVLTVLATAIVGSASWLIVQRTGSDVNAADSDTNPCFTSEAYFNGNVQMPELNELGEAVYGFDSPDDYTIVPLFEAYYRIDGTSMGFDDIGKSAGKHYYKIIDNTTGQIISERHEFVIKPDTLVATVTEGGAPSFVGDTVTFTATVVGKYTGDKYIYDKDGSKRVSAAISGEYTSVIGDYTPASDLIYNASVKAGGADISDIASVAGIEAWIENNFDVDALDDAKFEVTVPLLPTCYSYVGTATADRTYYGNIDQALAKCRDTAKANASNSYTLVAMQSFTYTYTDDEGVEQTVTPTAKTLAAENRFKHEITASVTIPSNLTLLIPYDANGTTLANGTSSSYSPECKSLVTVGRYNDSGKLVGSGITLINNGTITVGGVLGNLGQAYAAATSGSYAILSMGAGSKITNCDGSSLLVYGYITDPNSIVTDPENIGDLRDLKPDKTATIDCESGSIVKMPYVVYDYGGGSHTAGAFRGGDISPFNIFDMPNVQVKTVYKHGAKLEARASLTATPIGADTAEHNITSVRIIDTSNALLNLLSKESQITIKHTPVLPEGKVFGDSAATSKLSMESRNQLVFEGKMTTGDMSMSIDTKIPIIGETTVSMSEVLSPISHKFKLNFAKGANCTIISAYKLLPGAEVTIESGASVTTEADLIVYSDQIYNAKYGDAWVVGTSGASTMWRKNNKKRPGAILTVNGTLTAKAGIGGNIRTGAEGGKLDLTGTNTKLTVSSREGNGDFSISLSNMFQFVPIYTENGVANGIAGMSNSAGVNANLAKAEYTSVDCGNGIYVWTQYTITYNWVYEGSKHKLSEFSQNITNPNPAVFSAVVPVEFDVPTVLGGEPYFDGWYADAACTVPIYNTSGKSTNLTVYGKWVDEIMYTVNYVTNINCGTVSLNIASGKVSEGIFNPYTNTTTAAAMNNTKLNATLSHYIIEWYTSYDESTGTYSGLISADSGLNITRDTTFYAKWEAKSVVNITTSGSPTVSSISATTDGSAVTNITASSTLIYLASGSNLNISASKSGSKSGFGPSITVTITISASDSALTSATAEKKGSGLFSASATASTTANWNITKNTDITITGTSQ